MRVWSTAPPAVRGAPSVLPPARRWTSVADPSTTRPVTATFLIVLLLASLAQTPGASSASIPTPSVPVAPPARLLPPALAIASFVANPSSVLAYNPVYLNVTARGGTPPYSYWYQNLPPGCTTQNVSSLLCHPHNSQHYVIEATVNDSVGNRVNATANLTITSGFGPAPKITSFRAFPSPATLGRVVYLAVNAVSQSATPTPLLAYAFIGLPPGCATFNQTNLSCIPTESGTYQIWVRVTDSFAQPNQTDLFLNVTGTSEPSHAGGSPLSPETVYEIIAVVVALAAAAAVYFAVVQRRRRPPRPLVEHSTPRGHDRAPP